MDEPWKLKESDERTADSKPLFIIFCEDEVSEPVYFKYFATDLIEVNLILNQKSGIHNVFKALDKCKKDGIIVYDEKGELSKKGNNQPFVWCVFDRDINLNKVSEGELSFNFGIKAANESGINVAWSNDAFELWILLHFEEIDPSISDNKNRKTYYDRLTEIYKSRPNPNINLEKALKHKSFNYKQDLKSNRNFKSIVISSIIGNTQLAINRAKVLEDHFSNPSIPPHQKAPCTMVHHLVLELLKYGEKKIDGFAIA